MAFKQIYQTKEIKSTFQFDLHPSARGQYCIQI